MRAAAVATLIGCLALGACQTTADKPEQEAAKPAAPAADAAPAAQPPPQRSQATARTPAKPAELPPERDPQYTPEQRRLMIRQICWGQVDRQRNLRGDDARIAWVTKCIADKTKEPVGQPATPQAAAPAPATAPAPAATPSPAPAAGPARR